MRTKFKLKAKKSWPPFYQEKIKEAVHWANKRLKINTLPVDVIIRFAGSSEDFGGCSQTGEYKYVIWLHSGNSLSRSISTVFHELAHIKQHIYEGLELIRVDYAIFRGNIYRDIDYWTAPWEVEARKTEKELFNKYMKEHKCLLKKKC